MAADSSKREAGSEWRAIAQKSGTREFAAAFTANPVLETSVLNGPFGRDSCRRRVLYRDRPRHVRFSPVHDGNE
jgi:hypothetical protein